MYMPVQTLSNQIGSMSILNDYFGSIFTDNETENMQKLTQLFAGWQKKMSDIICAMECILEILGHLKTEKRA